LLYSILRTTRNLKSSASSSNSSEEIPSEEKNDN